MTTGLLTVTGLAGAKAASRQAAATPSLSVSLAASGNFTVGQNGVYTVGVSNVGTTPTSGTITVVDSQPPGLSYVSGSGTGWSCGAAGGTVTCTTAAHISGGGSAPPISLTFVPDLSAADIVTDTVTASGGGAPSSATASVQTAVVVGYGPQQTLGSALPAAFGVAVDGPGDIYVADANKSQVVELPVKGAQRVLPFSGLNQPRGVAVDTKRDVFVADSSNNRVVELPAGGSQQTLPFTGLNQPRGIAVDTTGDVFVVDTGNNQVVELPAGGSQQTLPFTGLNQPRGIAVGAKGEVFVVDTANNRVLKLTSGHGQQTLAFSALNQPVGVALDGDGNVFVTDPVTAKVLQLPRGGVQQDVPFTGLADPRWVALDAKGDLFVTDTTLTGVQELPAAVPVLSVALSSGGQFKVGQNGTYSITVGNVGLATTLGSIKVTDTLPAGLSYVSASGTGWACSNGGQTVTCTTSGQISAGSAAPVTALTVLPSANAVPSVIDTASASGGQSPTTATVTVRTKVNP